MLMFKLIFFIKRYSKFNVDPGRRSRIFGLVFPVENRSNSHPSRPTCMSPTENATVGHREKPELSVFTKIAFSLNGHSQ